MPDPRTAEERLRAAAEATEKLVRQYVMLFGGHGHDEQTIIRSLDALRVALAAEPVPAPLERAIYCTGACDACRDYARELGVPLIVPPSPLATPPEPKP